MRVPPQLSLIVPQLTPWVAHVVGVQHPFAVQGWPEGQQLVPLHGVVPPGQTQVPFAQMRSPAQGPLVQIPPQPSLAPQVVPSHVGVQASTQTPSPQRAVLAQSPSLQHCAQVRPQRS